MINEQDFESRAVVIREGASLHTADELALCFVDDCLALGASLSPFGREVYTLAADAFGQGQRWLADPDLADALHSVADQIESDLPCHAVVHDDGYVIYLLAGMTDDEVDAFLGDLYG